MVPCDYLKILSMVTKTSKPDPLGMRAKRSPAKPTSKTAPTKSTYGGAGRGQGRKSPVKRNAEKVAALIAAGRRLAEKAGEPLPLDATPLDVMIMAMREAYAVGGSLMAFPYAEKAAPYLHARISSIELKAPPPPANTGDKDDVPLVEFVDVEVHEILGLPSEPSNG